VVEPHLGRARPKVVSAGSPLIARRIPVRDAIAVSNETGTVETATLPVALGLVPDAGTYNSCWITWACSLCEKGITMDCKGNDPELLRVKTVN
jgi:hypothetical protein